MKTIFLMLMAFSLLFASLTSSSTANDVGNLSMDDIYRKKIIGKWSEGESPYGISSFEAGGIYRAWMYDNARKEKLLHTMKGKWWIEKGKLYNTISEITPPIPGLKAGDVVIDRIVDITDDVMTLIEEDGRQYTNKKVKE